MSLQLRLKLRSLRNPSSTRSLSSSSSKPPPPTNEESPPSPKPSSFSSIKASLKKPPPQQDNNTTNNLKPPPRKYQYPPILDKKDPPKIASLEEIRKSLSEFRRRSSSPDESAKPPSSSPSPPSFQELYKRNMMENIEETNKNGPKPNRPGRNHFDSIRESLRSLQNPRADRGGNNNNKKFVDPLSLGTLQNTLKMNSGTGTGGPNVLSNVVIGGKETATLPSSVFGREIGGKREMGLSVRAEFYRQYKYAELGEKLKRLRPSGVKGGFSLKELNERLARVREEDEKEMELKSGPGFLDIRNSLSKLKISNDEKSKRSSLQRLDILGHLGLTNEPYMRGPPKEHLVEKYFHPDNMSSEEKLKLELKKVRDEFKMSESDCGSSRVQVAQLTTKIKYLSSVLHKKDKHSQKGLMAMVQRRKKLLKYLRRTDWDSYCFVISKLGLRDNPDYKEKEKISIKQQQAREKKRKKNRANHEMH